MLKIANFQVPRHFLEKYLKDSLNIKVKYYFLFNFIDNFAPVYIIFEELFFLRR